MRGIKFNNLPPIRPVEPGRMDVACFVGFAPLARTPLFSDTLKRWLEGHGWSQTRIGQLDDRPALIRNTPVPLESWDAFCAVFSDHRLDRLGRLHSRTLADPLSIPEKDRVLHVIVDHGPTAVTLVPDAPGRLSLEALEAQINDQLDGHGASAFIDPVSGSNLILQREDGVTPGELSVYANESLGFPQTVQADAHYLPHYAGAAVKAFFR
jgi:hypothetical protein